MIVDKNNTEELLSKEFAIKQDKRLEELQEQVNNMMDVLSENMAYKHYKEWKEHRELSNRSYKIIILEINKLILSMVVMAQGFDKPDELILNQKDIENCIDGFKNRRDFLFDSLEEIKGQINHVLDNFISEYNDFKKEDGCRYGMADGPDDVCKECDCGDEYIKTNEIVWK